MEYSYPTVSEGESLKGSDLPEPWKHLPTLALPDGAHNYEQGEFIIIFVFFSHINNKIQFLIVNLLFYKLKMYRKNKYALNTVVSKCLRQTYFLEKAHIPF